MALNAKKCPHCNTAYEQSGASRNTRSKYGAPLKRCASCNKYFRDNEYREIAIDGIRPGDRRRITSTGLIVFLFALAVGLVMFLEGVSGWWVAAAIGLYSPLSELFTYKKRLAELDAEAEASDRRLHDPEYAATLKRLGYAVPEKYLVQKQPK